MKMFFDGHYSSQVEFAADNPTCFPSERVYPDAHEISWSPSEYTSDNRWLGEGVWSDVIHVRGKGLDGREFAANLHGDDRWEWTGISAKKSGKAAKLNVCKERVIAAIRADGRPSGKLSVR